MDTSKPEYQRAETLDRIFKFVGSQPKGQQFLFAKLAVQLQMDEKVLGKLLTKESATFQVLTTGMNMANGKAASYVFLSKLGRERFEEGWTYIKQLEKDEIEENQRKKRELAKQRGALAYKLWGIGSTALFILFAYLTWEATKENKVHDEKEERWEQEKANMQKQIDNISAKYYMIPDSIRKEYERYGNQ